MNVPPASRGKWNGAKHARSQGFLEDRRGRDDRNVIDRKRVRRIRPSGRSGRAGGSRKRREVSIAGRRVKVVDVHAHCVIPEVWDIVKDTPLAPSAGPRARGPNLMGPDRIRGRSINWALMFRS